MVSIDARILIVEDESIIALALVKELEAMGATVVGIAASEEQAMGLTERYQPDLIVMDINLGAGGNGIQAAREIYARHATPVVYTTAYSDDATMDSALATAPYGYLVKPYTRQSLKSLITLAIKRIQIERGVASQTPCSDANQSNNVADDNASDNASESAPNRQRRAFLETMSEGVLVLDSKRRVRQANQAATQMLEKAQEALLGQSLDALLSQSRASEQDPQSWFGEHTQRAEVRLRTATKTKTCLLSITPHETATGEQEYLAVFTDISALREHDHGLGDVRHTDGLTGAGNRQYLSFLLAEQSDVSVFNLIYLDLDAFRDLAERHGQEAADKVLIVCAERMHATLRANDRLMRVSDDDFVVLTAAAPEEVRMVAERILGNVCQTLVINGAAVNPSASIGIALGQQAKDSRDLLRQADIALHEAKQSGNRITQYAPQLSQHIDYRLLVEEGLEEAVEQREICAYFQPIFDREGRIYAVEALARWHLQDAGVVSPERFIPVAESSSVIHKLGMLMFREACIALKMLFDHDVGDIKIHVNVSAVQLQRADILNQFHETLVEFGLSAQGIVLELTESTLQDKTARQAVRKLRQSGFAVALDDFGTGFAALNELSQPDYDAVKLDKSLVPTGSKQSNNSHAVMKHIVALCKDVALPITIEGLETDEQFQTTHALGCHRFQGYQLAPPMHLFDLLPFLKEHAPHAMLGKLKRSPSQLHH